MRIFVSLLWLFSTAAFSDENKLIGSWYGADTASMSIYGTMKITKNEITWEDNNKFHNKCHVSYTIIPEDFGVTFEDQVENKYTKLPDSKFSTYLLKIGASKCTNVSYFRLTVTVENYLAMIEYDKAMKETGLMHFGWDTDEEN